MNPHDNDPDISRQPDLGELLGRPNRWRTGRKVGRTIYHQRGPEPSDHDRLIGVLDTAELAQRAVDAVNVQPDLDALKAADELGAETQEHERVNEVLYLVADWIRRAENGFDTGDLVWELQQAGYRLPRVDGEDDA